MIWKCMQSLALIVAMLGVNTSALAEDGYDLWLRYRPLTNEAKAKYTGSVRSIVDASTAKPSATRAAALAELTRGFGGLLNKPFSTKTALDNGAVVLASASDTLVKDLALPLDGLGAEGFLIKTATLRGKKVTVIAAQSDVGLLYGSFHLLRLMQTQQAVNQLDVVSVPKMKLRVLNHWDNLTGTVERGYSGGSIFNWWRLPDLKDPRLTDYARANASIGINGAVINNVNSKPESLHASYIAKAAAIADMIRPYGMKVYITANFATPMELDKLPTADPLDPQVRLWWKKKADEIYKSIPDFGGFLVKANSEHLPGPQDYGRDHADGANMLAEALKPHGGVVMWRAFVYDLKESIDRNNQSYSQFTPLDGKFADNVLVQAKNGTIDFQPREPFHPLFGGMKKTPMMMEFEITKEYTGFATHLVYLGSLYEEVLRSDTYRPAKGSTVSKVIQGKTNDLPLTGIAGVANTGTDRNWSGSDFDQANWYVFGRLAWNPDGSAREIADDWLRMTFTNEPKFVKPMLEVMMGSRETMVRYMMPLGLHHLKSGGHNYGPAPWVDNRRVKNQNSTYFHRATVNGIGYDRTKTGSNGLGQYAQPFIEAMEDPTKMDQRYLLWFHHVPWDFKMQTGNTLWYDLVSNWTRGVNEVKDMQATWLKMQPYVDAPRFEAVKNNFPVQIREAQWWRDSCIAYFQDVNKLPLPQGFAPPAKTLEEYKSEVLYNVPGNVR
jgi:alpha-glucuronidase